MSSRYALAGLALATLLACGGEDSDPGGLGPMSLRPVPGCERLDHRPCDVSAASCQERLMKVAACIRGNDMADAPEPPPISTMTEAEYAAYLNEYFTQEPPPNPNHFENALVMLGLATVGSLGQGAVVADQVKFVGGIYRSDTDDIVLVEHEQKLDPLRGSVLLVHELVHALQDRDVDLEAFSSEYATSTDSLTAVRALVEGEATLHEDRYAASVLGLDPASVDWRRHFSEAIERRMGELADAPSPYGAAYRDFAYTWGARYAHLAFENGGLAGVLARYASPALSTRTIMASVDGALADELGTEIAAPTPPAEWAAFTDTSLGALGVYLVTERLTSLSATSLATALAWQNDRLFVFASTIPTTAASTTLVWRLDFTTEEDAALFEERVASSSFTKARAGNRVTIARTSSGAAVPWAITP